VTCGVLGGALASTVRALGVFWANVWGAYRLGRERSRLSAVIDHCDVAILALEPSGRIVIWNVAMADLVGTPAKDAIGMRAEDLFTLASQDGSAVSLADRVRGNVRLTTPAGRSLWVQVSSSALEDAEAPELLTAVFVDMSAKRQLEYLQHLQLISVHHELHGPLTTIRGHAQLLDTALPDNESAAGSLGAILDSVEMMHHVMGDLVLIVDTDPTARPTVTAEPIDVALLLRRTLRSIPSVGARTVTASPPVLTVQADPVRLRQCLLLVLGNAEKYAPIGKITITVRTHGTYGVISITDEGPGIPDTEHHLALKPYYRSATTQNLPGSGMGLHIAEMIMTAMHGRIELTTAPSGGLEVNLCLPLS
jgi:PAS domain S-box-containing protein